MRPAKSFQSVYSLELKNEYINLINLFNINRENISKNIICSQKIYEKERDLQEQMNIFRKDKKQEIT